MLDINSPLGQQSLDHEIEATTIFLRYQGKNGYSYVHTNKAKPVPFDAYLMMGDSVRAIVETKCRSDTSYLDFKVLRKNTWLLTESKLLKCCTIAASMKVPLYGFLYFTIDKTLLVMQLSDKRGIPREYTRQKTETKATINGGIASRWNALIRMDNARVWK